MDATSHNIVASCLGFLANSVASDCMGLNVCPVSNYTQQVPTLLWFHGCKRTQHVGPNSVACCWPTMLRPYSDWVASVCKRAFKQRGQGTSTRTLQKQ